LRLTTGSHRLITEKLIESFTASQTDFPAEKESKVLFPSFQPSHPFSAKFSYPCGSTFEKVLSVLLVDKKS
jgi:hypothetical protein